MRRTKTTQRRNRTGAPVAAVCAELRVIADRRESEAEELAALDELFALPAADRAA